MRKFFIISPFRNIITCIFSFYFGMETIKFKRILLDNNKSFLISFLLLFFLSSIKIQIPYFIQLPNKKNDL